ncbi:MAG: DoxX family protein [Gammaproteobacteria bacterium]|nr:DoxX family protein [Gammaproteobacteria bacterium]
MADDTGKLILRLALGVLILFHGVAKLIGGISSIEGMVASAGLPGLLANGVYLGEVIGPILLILGFYARIGALLVAVNMLFAAALAHLGQLGQFAETGGWQLELQGMFLFAAIALFLTGPGRLSVNGH